MSGRKLVTVLSLGAVLLSGCATPPLRPYAPPKLSTPAGWTSAQAADSTEEVADLGRWWTGFHDPVLDRLIQRALTDNLDLRIASQRLLAARANREAVAAARAPHLGVLGGAQVQRSSRSVDWPRGIGQSDVETLQLEASWEPDLFGRLRASVALADAQVGWVQEDRRAILTALLADLASHYVELRSAQRRQAIAEANVQRLEASYRTVARLRAAGLSGGANLAQARAEWQIAQAQAPIWRARIAQHSHTIELLVGAAPGELEGSLAGAESEVPVAPHLPATAPADILRERPDVRVAERRLAASAAKANIAVADLAPRVRIPLNLGLSATGVGPLVSGESVIWSLAGSVAQTLSDGGQRKARVRAADATTQADVLAYELALRGALRDVEDALALVRKEDRRQSVLVEAVKDSQVAFDRASLERRAGTIDYLDLLVAQRALHAAQDALAESRASQALSMIKLAKALGGGWRDVYPEPPPG